jgi:hypothetical protein
MYPPESARAAFAGRRRETELNEAAGYQTERGAQLLSLPYFWAWQREAVRLFAGFCPTGDQKHLAAFCTHVTAMRAHIGRWP